MKREAIKHPQMMDLASRLEVDRARAVGIITLLLDWTADYAIQGNIGKHSDGVIARACGWGESVGDAKIQPSEFVNHLVGSGWIDRNSAARLLIHNWPTHCERWVLAKLKSSNLKFHPAYTGACQVTKERAEYLSEEAAVDTVVETAVSPVVSTAPRDLSKPILTEPNLTKPKPARVRSQAFSLEEVSFPGSLDTPEVRVAAAEWLEHKRTRGEPYKSPASFAKKLAEWSRAGPDAFVAAVNSSIGNNYQGIFPPKDQSHGNRRNPTPYLPNAGVEFIGDASQ